eukprot:GHVQ01037128.1.p1 GENE.GHVQ01037128.1~~GHVQ01037128.1.p1  ORF type:complete len:220 (-),score=37.39 GHVQ01037128.1:98-757(-)
MPGDKQGAQTKEEGKKDEGKKGVDKKVEDNNNAQTKDAASPKGTENSYFDQLAEKVKKFSDTADKLSQMASWYNKLFGSSSTRRLAEEELPAEASKGTAKSTFELLSKGKELFGTLSKQLSEQAESFATLTKKFSFGNAKERLLGEEESEGPLQPLIDFSSNSYANKPPVETKHLRHKKYFSDRDNKLRQFGGGFGAARSSQELPPTVKLTDKANGQSS